MSGEAPAHRCALRLAFRRITSRWLKQRAKPVIRKTGFAKGCCAEPAALSERQAVTVGAVTYLFVLAIITPKIVSKFRPEMHSAYGNTSTAKG